MSDKKIKVCLVGSSGGHLDHLYILRPFWEDKERFWATFDKEDARSQLKGEKIYPVYYPSNRSLKALIINTHRAIKILRKERPDLIISAILRLLTGSTRLRSRASSATRSLTFSLSSGNR